MTLRGPDEPVWNYLGVDPAAGFWLRRMANESLVHHADGALAVGAAWVVDPESAADALSEWLLIIDAPAVRALRAGLVDQSPGHRPPLHLHATDSPSLGAAGEWLIRPDPEVRYPDQRNAGAPVVVRALAADLLLAVLGRIPADDHRLEIDGALESFVRWVRHFSV